MSQPQTEDQYLKNLLSKHENKSQRVGPYLRTAEAGYEDQIKEGNYQIKTGAQVLRNHQPRRISKSQAERMKSNKKHLQQNLQLIDSRIGELTESDVKRKMVDDDERRKFVSQMAKARKQLEKKREQKLEQQQKAKLELKLKLEAEENNRKEEARKMRHEDLMKRAESMEVVRKNKKEEFENHKKILKAKMEEKTLSDRMLERFRQQEEMNLEDRKKKLAEIRSLHHPLTKSEFQLHLEKLDQLKSQKSRINSNSSRYTASNPSNTKFYKSAWYKKAEKQPVKYGDQAHVEELEQAKQMKDKLKKYSEYVRHNFKPEQMEKKPGQPQNKNKTSPIVKTEELRELGLQYLQYSKKLIDPNKKENEEEDEPRAFKHKNYLEDLKKNSKGSKNPQEFIEGIKNNKSLSKAEKAQKILDYVDGIERKVKMKEKKETGQKAKVNQELDDLYMEAIAIKMSMLGND